MTELKGLRELTGHVFSERRADFSGFAGPPKTPRRRSADSKRVVSQVTQPKKARHVELKGLTNHVFGERWTTFSGFAGPPKRGDADLLIQKGLVARWRWTGGERLLNLKDLLTVLPPSP